MQQQARDDWFSYAGEMDAALEQKFRDIKPWLKPGKIIDEGCGTGALLKHIAQANPTQPSQLIGVDGSAQMVSMAQDKVQNFARSHSTDECFPIEIYQHPLGQTLPARCHGTDVIISSSVMHELHSFGHPGAVHRYVKQKLDQLAPGGRLIIRDVVGPTNPDTVVTMELCTMDGYTRADVHPGMLSTRGLFDLFTKQFVRRNSNTINYEWWGSNMVRLRLQDAAEFMLKLPYRYAWHLEIMEEFTHWSRVQWEELLQRTGFNVLHCRDYTNPWRVENHFHGRVKLFDEGGLSILPPPTNIVVVGEKP